MKNVVIIIDSKFYVIILTLLSFLSCKSYEPEYHTFFRVSHIDRLSDTILIKVPCAKFYTEYEEIDGYWDCIDTDYANSPYRNNSLAIPNNYFKFDTIQLKDTVVIRFISNSHEPKDSSDCRYGLMKETRFLPKRYKNRKYKGFWEDFDIYISRAHHSVKISPEKPKIELRIKLNEAASHQYLGFESDYWYFASLRSDSISNGKPKDYLVYHPYYSLVYLFDLAKLGKGVHIIDISTSTVNRGSFKNEITLILE